MLNLLRFKTFVKASAAWAPRKQSGCPILELPCADHAAQPIPQCPPFAAPAVPLPDYPEEDNRRKKNQQIDRDQRRETNADHGVGVAAAGGAMSLPQLTVAVVQMRAPAPLVWASGKRQRVITPRACASRAGSPEARWRNE